MIRAGPLLRLARPPNVALAAGGTIVGGLAAAGRHPAIDALLLASAAAALGVAGGNAVNDATDAEVDRSAHPGRPVPSGELTPRDAAWWGAAWLAAALGVAAATNLWALLLASASVAALVAYELRLKARGVSGNLVVSANVGALFLLGALASLAPPLTYEANAVRELATDPRLAAPAVMAALAALLNLAREIYKGAEDAPHDAATRRTLAVRLGPQRARRMANGLVVALIPLALAPATPV